MVLIPMQVCISMVMIPRKVRISMVMIPMLHGDKTNAASRLDSTSQIEMSTEENIIQVEYSPLKYRILDND
jgi:hypothetical protein